MKTITLVILTFNTSEDTHVCLESLMKVDVTGIELKIVIVDNGSKEPFTLTDKEKKELSIHLLRESANLGFTGGNNVGIQFSLTYKSDYIVPLNNDTIVEKHMLQHLLAVAESDPKIGLVVPKIYFAKGYEYHKDRYKKDELGKVFWYAGGFDDWANVRTVHRGVDEVDRGQYDNVEEIGFSTGCCMFTKREIFEKTGLFDDKYFLYFEDADLNERIKRAGYKIMYVPKAILWHVSGSSTGGSGSNLQDYFLTRNRMLFGMRFAPLRSKIALIRESLRLLRNGRPMQQKGIRDFYLRRFNKGTYFVSR